MQLRHVLVLVLCTEPGLAGACAAASRLSTSWAFQARRRGCFSHGLQVCIGDAPGPNFQRWRDVAAKLAAQGSQVNVLKIDIEGGVHASTANNEAWAQQAPLACVPCPCSVAVCQCCQAPSSAAINPSRARAPTLLGAGYETSLIADLASTDNLPEQTVVEMHFTAAGKGVCCWPAPGMPGRASAHADCWQRCSGGPACTQRCLLTLPARCTIRRQR